LQSTKRVQIRGYGSGGGRKRCQNRTDVLPVSGAAAAGLDRSSVKWTHFFLRPEDSQAEDSRVEEPPRGCPASRRVVSDPMLNKAGRLRYILCGDGALSTISARADDEGARASGFMDLRRGDAIRAEGLEERPGGGLGIGSDSRLELVSRAPEAAS
jgi:hypothetical protein